uniref:Uncharacterized protein n=1 Tax=Amphimedon queenslandica TaxID=400682 RepID=A0A1X7TF16_AMPQE
MALVVKSILFVVLYHTFLTTSNIYSPHDGLDCIALYNNGSKLEVTSEEQAESENVTEIRCYGSKVDIAGGIGHAAALSWIFVSIVLWIKLNWHHEAIKRINTGKNKAVKILCGFCLVGLYLLQIIIFLGSLIIAIPVAAFVSKISQDQILDIELAAVILASGIVIIPDQKKSKSLVDHCKEAVENNKGEEVKALEEIKKRVRESVRDHPIQVDFLLELAELECKKALADIYYYDIDSEKKRGEGKDTITEEEMKTIAQVAYRKIAPDDGGKERNDQESNATDEMTLEELNINTSSGENERANLLLNIRNPKSYSQLN